MHNLNNTTKLIVSEIISNAIQPMFVKKINKANKIEIDGSKITREELILLFI